MAAVQHKQRQGYHTDAAAASPGLRPELLPHARCARPASLLCCLGLFALLSVTPLRFVQAKRRVAECLHRPALLGTSWGPSALSGGARPKLGPAATGHLEPGRQPAGMAC